MGKYCIYSPSPTGGFCTGVNRVPHVHFPNKHLESKVTLSEWQGTENVRSHNAHANTPGQVSKAVTKIVAVFLSTRSKTLAGTDNIRSNLCCTGSDRERQTGLFNKKHLHIAASFVHQNVVVAIANRMRK